MGSVRADLPMYLTPMEPDLIMPRRVSSTGTVFLPAAKDSTQAFTTYLSMHTR